MCSREQSVILSRNRKFRLNSNRCSSKSPEHVDTYLLIPPQSPFQRASCWKVFCVLSVMVGGWHAESADELEWRSPDETVHALA